MSSTTSGSYQPYVEDYDSVISEVIPLSARRAAAAQQKSSLSQSTIPENDGVSDSGYSTSTPPHQASPPPPSKSDRKTPNPTAQARKEALRRGTPGPDERERGSGSGRMPLRDGISMGIGHNTFGSPPMMGVGGMRPPSRSFSKSVGPDASPRRERSGSSTASAGPRNIPNAKPRERSGTITSTGAAEECDCSDCKKGSKSQTSPKAAATSTSPIATHHHHNHWAGYGSSPHYAPDGYGYPPAPGYDYDQPLPPTRKREHRTSVPPPARPASGFSTGSYQDSYYPPPPPQPAHAPAPAAPSTCPPQATYMYPPPPLPTSSPAVATSPYAPPYGSYGSYPADPWAAGTPPTSAGVYDPYAIPPSSNRRNSLNRPTSAYYPEDAVLSSSYDYSHYPTHPPARRPSNRPSEQPRPPSWNFSDSAAYNRSMSVPPPMDPYAPPPAASTRKTATPGPGNPPPRRRDSSRMESRGPSNLSHAMESCAIDDSEPTSPPRRSHGRTQSSTQEPRYEYTQHSSGALMRRLIRDDAPSNAVIPRRAPSYDYPPQSEEAGYVSLGNGDDGLKMRYTAGIPIKVSVNGERVHATSGGYGTSPREARLAGYEKFEKRRSKDSGGYEGGYDSEAYRRIHAQMAGGYYDQAPSSRRRATVNAYD